MDFACAKDEPLYLGNTQIQRLQSLQWKLFYFISTNCFISSKFVAYFTCYNEFFVLFSNFLMSREWRSSRSQDRPTFYIKLKAMKHSSIFLTIGSKSSEFSKTFSKNSEI